MEGQEKKKILLIDDDPSLLLTLGDFLKFEGYSLTTADSGENGLKALKKMTPDLIILDMSMPGMGGMGFLKEITGSDGKPEHAVLVLTARANMAEFFANVDVAGFVAKPCDPNDLLMEVARIIFLSSGALNEGQSPARERKKLLVSDDDDVAREKIIGVLAEAGLLVDGVRRGPEVLEQAIVQRPHLVILKFVLAGMNGDAVASMMREMPNTRDIPVILYDDTGVGDPDKYLRGSTNVVRFIRKSDPDAILRAVNDVLAK